MGAAKFIEKESSSNVATKNTNENSNKNNEIKSILVKKPFSLQKALFDKKHPSHAIKKYNSKSEKQNKNNLRDKFASPTDRLLSPCSKKLNDHKSKLFKVNSVPTKLTFNQKNESDDYDSDLSDS
ncbi:hypothetical protein TPHA_0H01040 [Tetrapisispora phaffii CBS 4417]|uniref:Uncharacterized protein n=1 Tax=Tetrapisispora phaffii (strain ATCC 24235 / CBS 4417 / NBRC 1672 / NRRL Y-8282 / UCD 70-5) TaxID=1071381 RepID=G8BX08_TETPH|nr:hypothetical protein TPHA_0H01040 [Tetrapisispora phaffii CBS 4417]CCE64312.1 hypothetical protein TPHA_0H01040 [Tetrapisispora phaffii CBS 4417]